MAHRSLGSNSAFVLLALIGVSLASHASPTTRLYPIEFGQKWGYVDAGGQMVVEPRFDSAYDFSGRDRAAVTLRGKWGAIDQSGRVVIKPDLSGVNPCLPGGLIVVRQGGKYGYADTGGRIAIEPRYEDANCFGSDGIAVVLLNGRTGLIDTEGRFVMEPRFDEVYTGQGNDEVVVRVGNKWGFSDVRGNLRSPLKFDEMSHPAFSRFGLFCVRMNRKWGLSDSRGNIVAAPAYDAAFVFASNGLAGVCRAGKCGFIDTEGRVVIPLKFDRVLNFAENGLAIAGVGGKLGFIDKRGQFVIEPRFVSANGFSKNEWSAVNLDGRWGYVDAAGRLAIAPKFSQALNFDDIGLAKVEWHGAQGYIDRAGRFVAMPIHGCGTAAIIGKDNVATWPRDSRPDVRTVQCILWDYAIRDMDLLALKSLLAAGYRAGTDGATLYRVADLQYPGDQSAEVQRVFLGRQTAMARLLIGAGANLNYRGVGGMTPLHLAMRGKNEDMAIEMMDAGADVNAMACDYAPGVRACPPLLHQAFIWRKDRIVRAMLDHKADPNKTGSDEVTLLGRVLANVPFVAGQQCARSHMGVENCVDVEPERLDMKEWISLLLDYGADPNKPSADMPPLALTKPGDEATIRRLVARGGKVAAPLSRRSQIGPVTWAVEAGRDDLLQIGLSQVSTKLETLDLEAIGLAVANRKSPEVVQALLDRGADANLVVAPSGRARRLDPSPLGVTVLHLAAKSGEVDVAKVLIRAGANVNARTSYDGKPTAVLADLFRRLGQPGEPQVVESGFTPLMVAVSTGNLDMMKLLLKSGADVSLKTSKGRTARDIAKDGESRAAQQLIDSYSGSGFLRWPKIW